MSDNLHLAWCRLFARGLAASGVRDVVISPGSRSTPLVLGLDAEPALRKHLVIDERAAAFFALGQARLSGRPTALLCTSGTAAAHYFPAVAEASLAHVPLVLLTADRPWEAYDCAASQTIDQVKLFGATSATRPSWACPTPPPCPRCCASRPRRCSAPGGPPRGPSTSTPASASPSSPSTPCAPSPTRPSSSACCKTAPRPSSPPAPPDPAAIAALADAVRSCRRGLIVAGPAPAHGPGAAPAARALARALGYPLCAEATSQLRGEDPGFLRGEAPDFPVIGAFDALFRCPAFLQKHQPELVIELGLPPVSTAYAAWAASQPRARRFVVAPHGWNDPHGTAHALIWADPAATLQALLDALTPPPEPDLAWGSAWRRAFTEVEGLVAEELLDGTSLSEGAVARSVASWAPAGGALLVGNSGPARDIDLYGGSLQSSHSEGCVRVLHQRGAAGIDGLVAGAAGAASLSDDTVVLYLGDISLLHDIGSLGLVAQATRQGGSLVIVVTNNDGGRIFEQLPLARRAEVSEAFDRYFLTRHGGSFSEKAQAFGLKYRMVASRQGLDDALEDAVGGGVTLIEARVVPEEGARRRAQLWRLLAKRLEPSP